MGPRGPRGDGKAEDTIPENQGVVASGWYPLLLLLQGSEVAEGSLSQNSTPEQT